MFRMSLAASSLLAALACSSAASASVTLNSASRVAGAPAFTGFGPYTNTAFNTFPIPSGSFPNGMGSTNISQASDIQPSGVVFQSTVNATVSNVGPSALVFATTSLTLDFNIVAAPQEVSYSWSTLAGSSSVVLNDPALGNITLATNGGTLARTLAPGHYVLTVTNQVGAFSSAPSQFSALDGSFLFIPEPGLAALALPALALVTRRRSR